MAPAHIVVFGWVVAALAVGCAADTGLDKLTYPTEADVGELRLGSNVQVLGAITWGDARTTRYANPPLYRAYRFRAAAGDRVDAWVRSADGDAMAWVTDASRRVIAQNDDASADTLDAHVTTTLTVAGDYLLMFRDYQRQSQTFTVTLGGGPDFFACAADRDCVSVSRGGCCSAWQRVAVNASRADAYASANTCLPPFPPCARPSDEIVDAEAGRVPVCNTERRQCELVALADLPCGGRTANPHACPAGYLCRGPGLVYDAPGRCVRGCVSGEQTYAPGESYTTGCNTCSCSASGRALCTQRPCPACDPAAEPQRRYVGASAEICTRIRYACAAGEQPFSNTCGCGCEPTAR